MARPSDKWEGFAKLDPASETYDSIQCVLSSANFEHLEKCAVDSRRRHQTSLSLNVGCTINKIQFTSGWQNVVLELAFSDQVYWIARVPYEKGEDDFKTSLLSEIATMNSIRQRTSIPVPRVFDFEISENQPFGYPYVFMEYLNGNTLPDRISKAVPQQYHRKVADQFAKVFFELQNLTFTRIGRLWCGETANQPIEIINMSWHHSPGPLETSFEYFYNQRQGENREIVTLHPDSPDWLTACWVLKSALDHIIIEDRLRGPFPLCHLDLHFGNMLFDDDFNLTGIIDWSSAQAAPLEQLSVSPEFMIFPSLSEEENRPTIEFKNLVIQALEKMEKERDTAELPDHLNSDQKQSKHLTRLSTYLSSNRAEMALRQYMSSPRGGLFAGKMTAKLIYCERLTWEQLRLAYGTMKLV